MFEAAGTPCSGIAFDGEQIFRAPGNAVQRSAIFAGSDFGVGGLSLRERTLFGEVDDEVQVWDRSA